MGCLSCLGSAVWQNAFILVLVTAAVTLIQILETVGVETTVICVTPRTVQGLVGLFLSPFVHTSWAVLLSNLIGLWVLGFLLLMQGHKVFCLTYLWISLVSGFATYLIARPGPHCGMAGELCGIFAFLVCAVIWQRPVSVRTVLGLVAALFLYGGSMIMSLINLSGSSAFHSSWEQKVFGFAAGIAWALVFFKILMNNPRFSAYINGTEPPPDKRDTPTQTRDPEAASGPSSSSAPAGTQSRTPSKKSGFGFFGAGKKTEPPLSSQEERLPPAAPHEITMSPLYSAPHTAYGREALDSETAYGSEAPSSSAPEGAWGPSNGGAWG